MRECCFVSLFGLCPASDANTPWQIYHLCLILDPLSSRNWEYSPRHIGLDYIVNDTTPSYFLLDFNFGQFFAAVWLLMNIFLCILLSPYFLLLAAPVVLHLYAVASR